MNNIKRSFKKLHLKKNLIKFSSFVFSIFLILFSFSFSFATDLSSYFSAGSYTNLSYPSDNSIYLQGTHTSRNGSATLNSSGVTSFTVNFTSSYSSGIIYGVSGRGDISDLNISCISGCSDGGTYINCDSSSGSFSISYSSLGSGSSFFYVQPNKNITYEFVELTVNGVPVISPVVPIRYPFTFQNGYLLVVDLGSSSAMYSFDLSSKSEEYSNIGSEPFPDTNQSFWFSDSLPTVDETEIPSSSASLIDWQKGDKTNIFGQTQDMIASISGTSSGRYLYIYNPPVHYKWSGSSNPTASEVVNYPVTIDGFTDNSIFYVYDSYARLTDFSQGGRVVGTVTGDLGIGVVSDGAISVTTTDGAIFEQNSGGSTDISNAHGGSIAENISGLKQSLDNFVEQFIQLLSAPISHIQQLISAGSDFFSVFNGLFSWLPSDLVSVVVSALMIMVVIGVFKMLL